MQQIDWYFDFVSPFAYLASESLARLPAEVELRPQPILFAGLLKHWHTKGPAEIVPMRRFTFRHVHWLARRDGITLKLPPAHPFNPLRLLRLCIALGSEVESIQRLFRFVWAEGGTVENAPQWEALLRELGIDDAETLIGAPEVKAQLKNNTDAAIERGVFGVPSFVVEDEIFWGFDAIDFLLDYLADPTLLQSAAMRSVDVMRDPQVDTG